MQIDVGTVSDVPRHDTPDQPGSETTEHAHEPQGFEPHVSQIVSAMFALVHPGNGLDFVANFRIAGKVGRLDPAFADMFSGLHLGAIVFRLTPFIHEAGGFPGNLPPQFR
jgi:hypothetical protein